MTEQNLASNSQSLKPGFLIAGAASGVGKTTVTLALSAAALGRGLIVQPFKGGPDYLDAGHQTRIAGRASRNLDTWMLSQDSNRDIVRRAARGADVLIVEGMMGLFDGKDSASGTGSSAEIAGLLQLPIVLVVDAAKSARSIAAVVLGFETFDPAVPIAGVILNRVASERHFRMLESAILSRCRTPILGWLPREASIAIPERHLGLQTPEEQPASGLDAQLTTLAILAERHLDLNRIFALRCGLDLEKSPAPALQSGPRMRIGVARDAAFSFYYEDNLDLLRELGAEMVSFSPLMDRSPPPLLDAIYLGGGYPESHAQQLSGNTSMLHAIRDFAASGRPVYAECGGMMYLTRSLTDKEGNEHDMAGVLSFAVEMTSKLVRFGYVTVEFAEDCLLGPAGTAIRGHSFHHSRILGIPETPGCYVVKYSLSGQRESEGFVKVGTNVLASYIHLHFRANPVVAQNLLAAALAASSRSQVMP
jgi:cobyrinic acid a,c-diamide synthase